MKAGEEIALFDKLIIKLDTRIAELEAENERLREQNANYKLACELMVTELNALKEDADYDELTRMTISPINITP